MMTSLVIIRNGSWHLQRQHEVLGLWPSIEFMPCPEAPFGPLHWLHRWGCRPSIAIRALDFSREVRYLDFYVWSPNIEILVANSDLPLSPPSLPPSLCLSWPPWSCLSAIVLGVLIYLQESLLSIQSIEILHSTWHSVLTEFLLFLLPRHLTFFAAFESSLLWSIL